MHFPRKLEIPCPACGGQRVDCTVPTDRGAYCRCNDCGHMWHQDGPIAGLRRDAEEIPKRRSSDLKQRI